MADARCSPHPREADGGLGCGISNPQSHRWPAVVLIQVTNGSGPLAFVGMVGLHRWTAYPPNRGSGTPLTPRPRIANRLPRRTPSPGKRGRGGRAIEVT